ncbi:MAG: zf-HC2 domain-containing protein [Chthonomonas sp.]|nr:zf-HC2 domain-containing protein [Chthonomonas sp.]
MDTEKFECLAAQALVGRYLAGDDLPAEQQSELETHLAACPDCTTLLEEKRAELMRELANNNDSATPSPATAEPISDGNEVLSADQIAAMMDAANAAPVADPLPDVDDNAVLTPDQIAAMMDAANAEPVADNTALSADQIAAMLEPEPITATSNSAVEIVFDEEELPTANVAAAPEPVVAAAPAPVTPTVSDAETDAILNGGIDDSHLDDLLANIPLPVAAPVVEEVAVANEDAIPVVAEAPEEPKEEKPKVRIRVEGLPILLGKNLKTMAYSASLGLVLVAMTTFAKNPSTIFGERAVPPTDGAAHGQEAPKTDEHKPDEHKPDEHAEPKTDAHGEEPKTDEHAEPKTDEHATEPKTDEHAEEPVKTDAHAEADPHAEEDPSAAMKARMNKFASASEKAAAAETAHGDEHAPEPKKAPKATPSVSQENSYMVAREGSTTHKPQTGHKKEVSHKPTAPKTSVRRKPATSHAAPKRTTAKKPVAKKPSAPKPSGGGLKIYDEHGNPIN